MSFCPVMCWSRETQSNNRTTQAVVGIQSTEPNATPHQSRYSQPVMGNLAAAESEEMFLFSHNFLHDS